MEAFLTTLSGYLWGLPLICTAVFTGIYFTVGSRFFQFRKFGLIMKNTFSQAFKKSEKKEKGILTPFQAICVALAGTIGTMIGSRMINNAQAGFIIGAVIMGFRIRGA